MWLDTIITIPISSIATISTTFCVNISSLVVKVFFRANIMDSGDSGLTPNNPDYGLEKIPEGVDADEYRKNYMAKVKKYDFETLGNNLDEPIQRVVPPIWPTVDVTERNVEKPKDKELNPREIESLPIKGHRRSVNDNKLDSVKEGPGSILLKIVDNDGRKKIEIKFVTGENIEATKLRKNRSSDQLKSNVTFKNIRKYNQTTQYKHYDNMDDNVIQIKTNDVILLHVVNDSDIVIEKSVLSGVNNDVDMQEMIMNITDFHTLNKNLNNETKLIDLEAAEWKVKDLMHNNMYNFSLAINSENITLDSRNFSTLLY